MLWLFFHIQPIKSLICGVVIIFPHSTNQIIDLWCCDYFSSFNQSNHWFVMLWLFFHIQPIKSLICDVVIIFPHSTNQIIDLWCCDYFSSFNQSNHWFVVLSLSLSLSLPLSFLELPLHCYAMTWQPLSLPVWNQNEISWCFDRESSLPDACCKSFERTTFLESSWRRDWSCDSWPRKQWGLGPSYRSEVFWQW